MRILVTGGTGRVGANLVTRLLDKGHEVRSFVYPGDASRAHKLDAFASVETVTGDLRNLEDVRSVVKRVDAIVHLAAAFGGPFDNRQYLDINAMGTLNLLESVRSRVSQSSPLRIRLYRGCILASGGLRAVTLKSPSPRTWSPATTTCPTFSQSGSVRSWPWPTTTNMTCPPPPSAFPRSSNRVNSSMKPACPHVSPSAVHTSAISR